MKSKNRIAEAKSILFPFILRLFFTHTIDMTIRFIIYGLLGWCLEVFWTGLGSLTAGQSDLRAWTSLWMFPIYGLAIFLEPIYDKIKDWPIITRGGIYTLLIFSVEYLTGWLLLNTVGVFPWDYSHSPFSINGIIRLDYAPAWFIVGLLFERLYELLKELNIDYID
ncbi:putative ABC transporter permease [Fuchsiella alkaliacetigena]|uniref:putative ABC transporter permease n=1 Tax=Fuchsiella alkaliacetigena TaxID=957042 RepID=UPI00200B5AB0|nr:putative ABC transporter permease [Fuchsiella alkaliacetigena]MCK8823839.1 putative ABC transporter permease [Fuchsiella alkaliacetigena]